MNLLAKYREGLRAKYLDDFGAFCRRAWREIEPGALDWNWHHQAICEYLQLCYEREITRMIFCLPPRGLKSKLISVFFGAWVWAKSPGESLILTSYSDSLSEELNMARRTLLQSEWYQTTFPGKVLFSPDQNRREKYKNQAGGQAVATSIDGVLTGLGADYLLVDDLLSPQQSFSDAERLNANRFFDSTLRSRLNEPTRGVIIVVCQRLHENDLVGHLLESEPGVWTILNLPMEAEQDETVTLPLSGRVIHRKAGDLLHPARWPKEWVAKQKKTLGRVVWSSQFQQRPAPKEGNLVRVSDICFYGGRDPVTGDRDPDLPGKFERRIISVDAAFKDKSTSDYVCILVIGITGSRRYVLHIVNAHLNLDGTEREIRACHANFGPIAAILIEDKANGTAVVEHLSAELPGVIAVNPAGGKYARMMATAPEFEAHNWFFDRTGALTNKAIDQLCLFPNARHDDICDALSQAAIWLQAYSQRLGVLDWVKELLSGKRTLPSVATPTPTSASASAKLENVRCFFCNSEDVESLGTPPSVRIHCKGGCGKYFSPDLLKRRCWADGCELYMEIVSGTSRCQNHGQKPPANNEVAGHIHRWREVPGGFRRCDDCSIQQPIAGLAPQTVNGAPWAGRAKPLVGGFMLPSPFSRKFPWESSGRF